MVKLKDLESQAADFHGGIRALRAKFRVPLPKNEVIAILNEQFLSELSKVSFQIGFNWALVEKKWPAFEESFFGFDLGICSSMPDEAIEAAMSTGTIIKNWPKLKAIRANAQWFSSLVACYGSVGSRIAEIDANHYFESLFELQKGGTRVGVRTLQIWLRNMRVDAFVYTPDVERVLRMYGVIDKAPSSRSSWLALQGQVNEWMAEGDYSLSNVSQILAFSLGPNQ